MSAITITPIREVRLFLLFIAVTALAGCQTPTLHPGAAIAEQYWSALGQGDWTQLANLTHSESMADVKDEIIAAVAGLPRREDMPSYLTSFNSLEDVLDGMEIQDPAELEAMSPKEVYRRFLLQEDDLTDVVTSIMTGIENESETRIVGTIAESDSLVHVLRRAIFVGDEPKAHATKVSEWREGSKMDVLSLRLDSGEWKVWQNTGFLMKMSIRTMLTM